MRTIIVNEFHTAADVSALAGTELATMPGNGVCTTRAASTVNTATLEVQSPDQPATSRARAITLRANGEIRSYDPAWVYAVQEGERVDLALAGTPGTVQLHTTYVGS